MKSLAASRGRILVVEDENIVAMDIERSLLRLGYEVVERASRGQEAVQKTEENQPDLVLMDIRLKGEMTGIDAAGEIGTRFCIPVVFLTAYADDVTLEKATAAEPYGYLLKPFEENELHTVIEIARHKHRSVEMARALSAETLRATQEQLNLFVGSVHDCAIFLLDLQGRVRSWNPGGEVITGYRKEEIIGQSIAVFFPPEEQAIGRAERALEAARREGRYFSEGWLQGQSGTRFWSETTITAVRDAENRLRGFGVVSRDLTEQRRVQQKLEESEELFRGLFEQAAVGVGHVTLDGRFLFVNQRLAEILGRPREEFSELLEPELAHPEDRPAAVQRRERLRSGVLHAYSIQKRYLRPEGTVIWVNVAISPIRVRAGQEAEFVFVMEDISERKAAEQALQQLHQELEARVKERTLQLHEVNRELEQFAYVASHDLQEPLRMVASYTQLLAERYEGRLDEKADKFIRYAVEGATRMQSLINDLLTFSRVGHRGKPFALTDLQAVVEEVLQTLERAIEESGAKITVRSPLPNLLGDRSQLGQVLQNLLENAIKFRGEVPPEIEVSAQQQAGAWELAIRDNGIGIDAEFHDRIFTVFQRLHSRDAYRGNGIGLSLVKKIVERHGGRIWVESQPGQGTTMRFTIAVNDSLAGVS